MYIPHVAAMVGAGGLGAALKPTYDFLLRKREQTDTNAARTDAIAMELVGKLQLRIEALEQAGEAERAACAQQIEHQRELSEAKLAQLRHEVATYRAENQMLLLVIEMAPEKSAVILARLRQERGVPAATSAT